MKQCNHKNGCWVLNIRGNTLTYYCYGGACAQGTRRITNYLTKDLFNSLRRSFDFTKKESYLYFMCIPENENL